MAQAIASGMMKPGDKIRTVKGKGGPTSDSVPAKIDGKNVKLSAGEKTIVIPAAVAQNSEAMEQIAAIIASATGIPPQEGIKEGGEYATGSVPGDDERQPPKNIYQGSSIYQGAKNLADGVKGIGSALAAPVTKTADAVQSALTPADKPAPLAEPAKPLTPLTLTLTPTTPYKAPEQKAPGAISQGIGNLWQGAKDLASGLALPVTKTLDAIGSYTPNADPRTQPATPAMQPATQPVTRPATPSIASLPNANTEPSRPGVGAPATQPGGVYRAANGAMVRDVQMGGDTWTMLAAPTAKQAAAANDSIPAAKKAGGAIGRVAPMPASVAQAAADHPYAHLSAPAENILRAEYSGMRGAGEREIRVGAESPTYSAPGIGELTAQEYARAYLENPEFAKQHGVFDRPYESLTDEQKSIRDYFIQKHSAGYQDKFGVFNRPPPARPAVGAEWASGPVQTVRGGQAGYAGPWGSTEIPEAAFRQGRGSQYLNTVADAQTALAGGKTYAKMQADQAIANTQAGSAQAVAGINAAAHRYGADQTLAADQYKTDNAVERVNEYNDAGQIIGQRVVRAPAAGQSTAPTNAAKQILGLPATKQGKQVPDETKATFNGVPVVVKNGVWTIQ